MAFLAATLANMEIVLAKSDMDIAAHYLPLVEDKTVGERFFDRIRHGWQQTHNCFLTVTRDTPARRHPALDASIRLRLPYIEPPNLFQIELLKRHSADEDDPRMKEGIELSINGKR